MKINKHQYKSIKLNTKGLRLAGHAFREARLKEITVELEALRQAEVAERAAAAHHHQCAARAYEEAMEHSQRAEGLSWRIKELGWQRDTVMELAPAKLPGTEHRDHPPSVWK